MRGGEAGCGCWVMYLYTHAIRGLVVCLLIHSEVYIITMNLKSLALGVPSTVCCSDLLVPVRGR